MSLLILVTSIACFLSYSTSKRAVITKETKLLFWLHSNGKITKITTIVFFTLSTVFAIYTLGIAAGILTLFILIMLIWSLLVLLVPLQIVNYKLLLAIILISFFLEQTL